MQVEVKTRNGLRVKLNRDEITAQVKVDSPSGIYYRTIYRGAIVEVATRIEGTHLDHVTERDTLPTYSNAPQYKTTEPQPPAPSLNSGAMYPHHQREYRAEGKYRGEMVWTHKTAPEIAIFKDNKAVKNVNMEDMYKRR